MTILASLLAVAVLLIALALVTLLYHEEPKRESLAMARLRKINREMPWLIEDLHRRLDQIEAEERLPP